MSEAKARFAFCQRCTNGGRPSCTTDFIQGLIKFNLKIREGSVARTKPGSFSDIQEDWTEMLRVGVDMWIATIDLMKAFDSINHNSTWKAHNSCGIEQEYISFLKKTLQIPTSDNNDWQRATCSRSKGGPSKVTRCPVCSSTLYCRWLSKTTFHAGKRKKIGHMLGRLRVILLHKLTICWRRVLVRVFVRIATQLMCEIKQRKVELKIHPFSLIGHLG